MLVKVNGYEFRTNQVEIVFESGRNLTIDPDYVTTCDENEETAVTPVDVLFDGFYDLAHPDAHG